MNKGTISQVIGPVVDVHFKDKLPAIYNALEIPLEDSHQGRLTLEVQQQLPGNVVRTIAMSSTAVRSAALIRPRRSARANRAT